MQTIHNQFVYAYKDFQIYCIVSSVYTFSMDDMIKAFKLVLFVCFKSKGSSRSKYNEENERNTVILVVSMRGKVCILPAHRQVRRGWESAANDNNNSVKAPWVISWTP